MRILGEWFAGDDGTLRPTASITVQSVDGQFIPDRFLIDTGADRTVFSADLARDLRLSPIQRSVPSALQGIGGEVSFQVVATALRLTRDDGTPVTIRGEFATFADTLATDSSILGRDVLDIFDLIVSRRRNEILLLATGHGYRESRS